MASIEIYTTPWCPYCIRAKRLLDSKGLTYREIGVDQDPAQAQVMVERAGRRSVPQIFINGEHVGGSDELLAADVSGDLESLLNASHETGTN